MNQRERVMIGELWISLSQVYGKDISKSAIGLMLSAVEDLPFAAVESVMRDWVRTTKLGRHPNPAEIREKISPPVDQRSQAIEAATRVIASVSKFGWNNGREARAYIGELGWRAVERIGGWPYLCSNLGVGLSITTVQAQVRDLCESTLKLGDAGVHDQPIGLPEPKRRDNQQSLTSANNIVKDLMTTKKEK